tara:strand:+ start:8324 stop:8731 length:408 start_codon:yes stop_codon:yes gene_type:complete
MKYINKDGVSGTIRLNQLNRDNLTFTTRLISSNLAKSDWIVLPVGACVRSPRLYYNILFTSDCGKIFSNESTRLNILDMDTLIPGLVSSYKAEESEPSWDEISYEVLKILNGDFKKLNEIMTLLETNYEPPKQIS